MKLSSRQTTNVDRVTGSPATIIALLMVVAMLFSVTQSPSHSDNRKLLETSFDTSMESTPTRKSRRSSSIGNSKYPTIQCSDSTDVANPQRHAAIGSVSDPRDGMFLARRTTTDPPFWISLHQHSFDHIRWGIMTHGTYYETKQTDSFVEILQEQSSDKTLHFVDVGGNIGWFSLLSVAAALAVNRSIVVDVFEPNPRNRYRMCESLAMNRWLENDLVDFHLYPLGVSSSSGGVVQMSVAEAGTGRLGYVSKKNEKDNLDIHLVSLDDVAKDQRWEASPINILKVDVEGLELEVFQGAKRLMKSGRIQNIFFEGNLRGAKEVEKFNDIVKLLVESGYFAYKQGGTSGADKLVEAKPVSKGKADEPSLKSYIKALLDECKNSQMNTKNIQCNLWWKKTLSLSSSSSSAKKTKK